MAPSTPLRFALALDTASDYLSLGLWAEGQIAGHFYQRTGTQTNRLLFQEIQALLAQAGITPTQLQAVAVAVGPGSFTGARLGLAVAKSFGQILRIPVLGVDTLTLLAHQTQPQRGVPFHALLNCVRDEVYLAPFCWQPQGLHCTGAITLVTAGDLPRVVGNQAVVGRSFAKDTTHWEATLAAFPVMPLAHNQPDATLLLAAAQALWQATPEGPFPPLVPIYLKAEANRTWKR